MLMLRKSQFSLESIGWISYRRVYGDERRVGHVEAYRRGVIVCVVVATKLFEKEEDRTETNTVKTTES